MVTVRNGHAEDGLKVSTCPYGIQDIRQDGAGTEQKARPRTGFHAHMELVS